jgi:hypothetical protein
MHSNPRRYFASVRACWRVRHFSSALSVRSTCGRAPRPFCSGQPRDPSRNFLTQDRETPNRAGRRRDTKADKAVLVGIAGGFPAQKMTRGDVVVAKTIFAYDFGKLVAGNTFGGRKWTGSVIPAS